MQIHFLPSGKGNAANTQQPSLIVILHSFWRSWAKNCGGKKKVLLLKWCKIQIKCSFIAGHTSKFSSKRSVQPQRDRVTAVFVPRRLHSMQEFDKVRQNKCILSRLGWLLLPICCITVSWFSQEEKSAFRRCTSALCSISPFKRGPSFKRIFDLRA